MANADFPVPGATATFAAYWLATKTEGLVFAQEQTAAVLTLFGVSVSVLWMLARPLTPRRWLMIAGLVSAFGLLLLIPVTRGFLGLDVPHPRVVAEVIGLVVAAATAVRLVVAAIDSRHPSGRDPSATTSSET